MYVKHLTGKDEIEYIYIYTHTLTFSMHALFALNIHNEVSLDHLKYTFIFQTVDISGVTVLQNHSLVNTLTLGPQYLLMPQYLVLTTSKSKNKNRKTDFLYHRPDHLIMIVS